MASRRSLTLSLYPSTLQPVALPCSSPVHSKSPCAPSSLKHALQPLLLPFSTLLSEYACVSLSLVFVSRFVLVWFELVRHMFLRTPVCRRCSLVSYSVQRTARRRNPPSTPPDVLICAWRSSPRRARCTGTCRTDGAPVELVPCG